MPNGLQMGDVLTPGHIEQRFADSDWLPILRRTVRWRLMRSLRNILQCEEDGYAILPPADLIFEALYRTRLEDVKVVILGQEPYPNQGQADGLAFSMQETYAQHRSHNDSLKNIIREVNEDCAPGGSDRFQDRLPGSHVCLRPWADQGVLLLNTVLTFRQVADQPDGERPRNAHIEGYAGRAWKRFTTKIVKAINCRDPGHVVFMLWGAHAMKKIVHIDRSRHKVLCAQHPSYGAGIKGTSHFSCANEYLERNNREPIVWLQQPQPDPAT